MVTEKELRSLLETVADAYGASRTYAINSVMKVLEDSLIALREKAALERNLDDQINQKVDLQVLVKEQDRDLTRLRNENTRLRAENVGWAVPPPHVDAPVYPPGVRSGIDGPWAADNPDEGWRNANKAFHPKDE